MIFDFSELTRAFPPTAGEKFHQLLCWHSAEIGQQRPFGNLATG
jgi:hypothetical protein